LKKINKEMENISNLGPNENFEDSDTMLGYFSGVDQTMRDAMDDEMEAEEMHFNDQNDFEFMESAFDPYVEPDESDIDGSLEEPVELNCIYKGVSPFNDETNAPTCCYLCRLYNEYRFNCKPGHGFCFTCAAKLIEENNFPKKCPLCCNGMVIQGLYKRPPIAPSTTNITSEYSAFPPSPSSR
jgi:hypothetical protein